MTIDDLRVWLAKERTKTDQLLEAHTQAIGTNNFEDIDDKLSHQMGRVSVLRELLEQVDAELYSRRAPIRITSAGRDVLRSMEAQAS